MFTFTDPFMGTDRWLDESGRARSNAVPPLDAYRRGDDVWAHLDLPGVASDSIDIDIERSTLTITAVRKWRAEEGDQVYFNERPQGISRRQLNLGPGLDVEAVEADYHDGVLTLRIPLAEKAKPRKVEINTSGTSSTPIIETTMADKGATE